MKKLLFLALLALITFGCRTVKQTSTNDLKSKIDDNLTVKTSDKASLDINKNFSKVETNFGKVAATDKGSTNETTVEESETINFSAPDSIGKQFPLSKTNTKKTTVKGEKKDLKVNQDTKSTSDQETNFRDKSDYKSDKSIKDKGKSDVSLKTSDQLTQETKTPAWVYVAGLVSLLVLIGVGYGVLKRFGIIK